MKETRTLIEKMFLKQITELWQEIKQPFGIIADIPDKSYAYHEYADVENYFSGKKHNQIQAFNDHTKYMPNPLVWMNDHSALYYSQCYLRNFIERYNDYESHDSELIDMCLNYFTHDFKHIKNVNNEQVTLVRRIIRYIKPVLVEEMNLI